MTEFEIVGQHLQLSYTGEVDLRRKLAKVARAYGWLVREEVVIPGWGRIDLVLREHSEASGRLIELKVDLTKPAAIRRAFQQADGYGRWWTTHQEEHCHVHVVGATVARDHVRTVHSAYPELGFHTVGELLGLLGTWGDVQARLRTAYRKRDAVKDLLGLHEYAVEELNQILALQDLDVAAAQLQQLQAARSQATELPADDPNQVLS